MRPAGPVSVCGFGRCAGVVLIVTQVIAPAHDLESSRAAVVQTCGTWCDFSGRKAQVDLVRCGIQTGRGTTARSAQGATRRHFLLVALRRDRRSIGRRAWW